ncbi:MAG: glucosamine-6-phosphate deaminase [Acidimicrobiales bacterium]
MQTGTRIIGGATVQVHPDVQAMARAAADEAAAVLRAAVASRGTAHAMFATGNSQLAFTHALVHETDGVPWADTVVFHMDEYVGVGPDHPAGFQRWIRERIVEPARPRAAYYVEGLGDAEAECRRYADLLRRFPLDLCCLGIGENGHLAFNDPPVADFADPRDVKVVELEAACRRQQVNEGHFAGLDDVPTHAITVTVPALLRAGRVLAIVPEDRKAAPVSAALTGPVTTACPASALRTISHATVYLEPASARLLPD